MTTQGEEAFIHFATCLGRFWGALETLRAVKAEESHVLAGPAFRFALVEYVAPYTASNGIIGKHRLDERYVPAQCLDLHKRLVQARHRIHAHSDLTIRQAKLSLETTALHPYVGITGVHIDELEEMKNIDQIIELVEGTIGNMYDDQAQRIALI